MTIEAEDVLASRVFREGRPDGDAGIDVTQQK